MDTDEIEQFFVLLDKQLGEIGIYSWDQALTFRDVNTNNFYKKILNRDSKRVKVLFDEMIQKGRDSISI